MGMEREGGNREYSVIGVSIVGPTPTRAGRHYFATWASSQPSDNLHSLNLYTSFCLGSNETLVKWSPSRDSLGSRPRPRPRASLGYPKVLASDALGLGLLYASHWPNRPHAPDFFPLDFFLPINEPPAIHPIEACGHCQPDRSIKVRLSSFFYIIREIYI